MTSISRQNYSISGIWKIKRGPWILTGTWFYIGKKPYIAILFSAVIDWEHEPVLVYSVQVFSWHWVLSPFLIYICFKSLPFSTMLISNLICLYQFFAESYIKTIIVFYFLSMRWLNSLVPSRVVKSS